MEDLSLHILDVAENSINAGAKNIEIMIVEDNARDLMAIEIKDDGCGMDPATLERAKDPFYTTRTTRKVGLGLAFFEESAKAAGGTIRMQSSPGKGTNVVVTFRLNHIDRKPLGDIAETIVTLLVGHSDIDLVYRHFRDGASVVFDTKEFKQLLNGAPIDDIEILGIIKQYLHQEEKSFSQ